MDEKKTDSKPHLSRRRLISNWSLVAIALSPVIPLLADNSSNSQSIWYKLLALFAVLIIPSTGDIIITRVIPNLLLILTKGANPSVKKAPGQVLLSIVDFFFSPTTVENVFKPIVADWRVEYFDALRDGKRWKAQWIRVRYSLRFVMAMGLSKVLSLIRGLAHK